MGTLALVCCLAGSAFASGMVGASATRQAAPIEVVPDVPYGGPAKPALVLDVYRKASAARAPVVIAVHGGGWVSGDKLRFAPQSRALARAGFVVMDINYSLDPDLGPGYPRQVEDVRAALRWTRQHAQAYGGDPRRIAVVGGSAGGYLAAMLGVTIGEARDRGVQAVASLSGPMDFVTIASSIRAEERTCRSRDCRAVLGQARSSLERFLGCDPLRCPQDLLVEASPLSHVSATSPPFFLANGTDESIPADQAVAMSEQLRSVGVDVELHLVPGARHSVQYLPQISSQLLTFLRVATIAPVQPSSEESPTGAVDQGRRVPWRLVAAGLLAVIAIAGVALTRTRGRTRAGRPF